MAGPRLAGIRQPGLHIAGAPIGGGGGGGGGPTTAALTTLADAGDWYSSTEVEGALNEVGNSIFGLTFQMTTKADLSTLASHAAGAGASKVGIQDAAGLITATQVEAALQEIAYNLANFVPSGTIPLTQGGTGQVTAAAAYDALTIKAPDIASAATIDLSLTGCPGHYAVITGATGPVTSLGTAPAGVARVLRFASTPTITHNAATLILPGAANIVAAAGDVMFVHSLGAGAWRCTSYMRAASLPALVSDLASVAAGKGAATVGIQDAAAIITATTVEAALAELMTAVLLRTKIADLASAASGAGSALVGYANPGSYYPGIYSTQVQDTLSYIGGTLLPALAVKADLASVSAALGASLVGIQDAAALITATTVEGALAELAAAFAGGLLAAAALTNAAATVAVSAGSEFTLPPATLTANRILTLSTTGAVSGEVVRVIRRDATAFTYAVVNGGAGAGTMYTFPVSASRLADFQYDGTNWYLAGHAAINP